MKVFNYTGRPDVARAIKEFQREYQSLKALSHPSIIRFIAFDHIPADNAAYLRMQWASTELSDSDSSGAVDLEDIICHHDGLHSLRTKSFLPEVFIWHVLFHLSAALSHCHYGIKIQRKRIVEKTDTQAVLDRLTKKPPPYLRDLAIQHPRVSWVTERITFSVDTSHAPIIHRDIKPRNGMPSFQEKKKSLVLSCRAPHSSPM
jgi:serine/threonine protein kinase